MDLIRIYTEIAFSRVAESFLANESVEMDPMPGQILSEDYFIDLGRRYHSELSDDNLKMIYQLGLDEWSKFGHIDKCDNPLNIFQTLACFAYEMLDYNGIEPLVHFKDLFRWRDTSQLLGEDLLSCAFLAFRDRKLRENPDLQFNWPSVLHNDNPHLTYLFRTKRLCELHSHLKASSNVFEITWVSLMNYIAGQQDKFELLAKIHIPSRIVEVKEMLYRCVVEASYLRWSIQQWLKSESDDPASNHRETPDNDVFIKYRSKFIGNTTEVNAKKVDNYTDTDRKGLDWDVPDYITVNNDPMAVYAGERWFLYSTLKNIYATNNACISYAFYRYILAKSLLRSYFIQINSNIGFSNFQRFQTLKDKLLSRKFNYSGLLKSLPLWEARVHNYVKVFETRITPYDSKKNSNKEKSITDARKRLGKDKDAIVSFIRKEGMKTESKPETHMPDMDDWSIIFHFIKSKDTDSTVSRDTMLRRNLESQSKILKSVNDLLISPAVDAASSELAARPEVFGQAFRFLRHYGYKATFHAGEDFYDIADGLRAIDESIHLLKLKASDRLGHALALGIDAQQYYTSRHNYIAMPKQWMLDNVVWIIIRSKEFGISICPHIERFLENTYKSLCMEIGYTDVLESKFPDIEDYWESMVLRGDSPDAYSEDGCCKRNHESRPGDWEYYSLLDSDFAENVRSNNKEAGKLYYIYHHYAEGDCDIRQRGDKVKSFRLPDGYARLMTTLQDCMIKEVSKRQLCIECCPSSNVKIGKLERFDSHPIFRFMPLDPTVTRYPLAVTVNTDDLGVFATSLPNEYSLLALALLKKKDRDGNHVYSTQEVYDWIERVIENGHKFTFVK